MNKKTPKPTEEAPYQAAPGKEDRNGEMTGAILILPDTLRPPADHFHLFNQSHDLRPT